DPESGLFYSPHGPAKYYMATDNLQRPAYRSLLPNDLMDIIAQHQLHFDTSTETGAVFHLMGALSEFGKLGLTCIGNSPAQAEAIYAQMTAVLDQESQRAGQQVSPHLSPWMGWR
ncbi:MAG: carboxylate-amine ligase, partial [Gloeomargaritaceae cyanobacterium C42_A2020_066]|nr:carboxylate-amine ligase [Gloeomargaritaceae cyanobacterium C42_A2020_066]